ncbi:hypothetical protein SELMODRAFT_143660 [Selaginella moellendorffii]|uniref:Flavodoxin-like domain-containing protein n=1 Tax=Selaginella moellendorffii TaxID=88036 RepID=D8R4M7_SELML|nr:uncharacterized protein LOC9652172 [Selaginella moellendorffii]EFJ33500.1 hypothetical protein SELMODRAFT_143660 [Selaginella moellendorffii]|eukprot:XP_002966080.1 uncharacterized protein LOC9652172 [Selaginella moellendorffii]
MAAVSSQALQNARLLSCPQASPLLSRPRSVEAQQQHSRKLSRVCVRATKAVVSAPAQEPAPLESKKTYLRLVQLTDDTFSLRDQSLERLKFEVEYGLKAGTTDNSYIIKGQSCTALIDVPDQTFTKGHVDALAQAISMESLKYLVLGHISPKRLQTLIAIGDAIPENALPLQVYCSNPAAVQLTSSLPEEYKAKVLSINVVKSGETLDLGNGHELQFILTPTPRWPDGMCTYDPSSQLLFTQKLFSAHICTDTDFDVGGWEVFGEHWRFFYECMLGPVSKQADAALRKLPIVAQFSPPSYAGKAGVDVIKADIQYVLSGLLSPLNLSIGASAVLAKTTTDSNKELVVSAMCPLHGPIVRSSVTELVREYRAWTQEKIKQIDDGLIAVIYASAYGNTAALAQAISRGISRAGLGVESLNTEDCGIEEVSALVRRSNAFVIGSPTLAGHMPTPIQNALGAILSDTTARTKPCGVFGSFGWSGEAVDEMEQKLKDAGFSFAFPAIRCKFKPTEATLQTCEESGTDIAQTVKRAKLKTKESVAQQYVLASSVEQAAGRVVGALCVLSARNGDAESAMLASWVSQASFLPPGLTVAVAKERAVESLVLPGASFVLNVLGQGKSSAISRQLLKPFKPGEPRFGALETKEASNGGKILTDAIAWLECTVQSRMEAGDHWLLYAVVENGELQDAKSLTAVHHRKTGSRY